MKNIRAFDTTPEMEEIQLQALRNMSPDKYIQRASS